jgi:hypothetical protein
MKIVNAAIPQVPRPTRRNVALGLALVPGLVCVLGLGHLYLGFYRRAAAFLSITVVIGAVFLVALTPYGSSPGMSIIISPVIFPVGGILACLVGVYDVHKLTRVVPESVTRSTSGPA